MSNNDDDEDTPKAMTPQIADKLSFTLKCKQFEMHSLHQRARADFNKCIPKQLRGKKTTQLISSILENTLYCQAQDIWEKKANIYSLLSKEVKPVYKSFHKKILVIGIEDTLICMNSQSSGDLTSVDSSMSHIRPSAQSFINIMSCFYEIVVFSSLCKEQVGRLLKLVDENDNIKTVLSNEHCHKIGDDMYVKDLRLVSDTLKSVVIVDSNLYSISANVRNGILICPFDGKKKDKELVSLGQFLMEIYSESDLRVEITKKYRFCDWIYNF